MCTAREGEFSYQSSQPPNYYDAIENDYDNENTPNTRYQPGNSKFEGKENDDESGNYDRMAVDYGTNISMSLDDGTYGVIVYWVFLSFFFVVYS